jgi:hypothetical protein
MEKIADSVTKEPQSTKNMTLKRFFYYEPNIDWPGSVVAFTCATGGGGGQKPTTGAVTLFIIIIIIIITIQGIDHSRPVPVQNFNSLKYESIWTVGGTPWTGNQPDARPLPTQDNKYRKMRTRIHAPNGIRTRDPSVRAVEYSTCIRPRGHWNWHIVH